MEWMKPFCRFGMAGAFAALLVLVGGAMCLAAVEPLSGLTTVPIP